MSGNEVDDSLYYMFFRTVQSNAIKTLVEGLKDIVTDVNFNVSSGGIRVTAIDNKNVTMANLNLVANGFEYFHSSGKMNLGINMTSLNVFIKSVGNNDLLSMYVEKKDETKLNIVIENKEKNKKIKSVLRLLDLDYEEYSIPDIKFDSVIKLPANDFQKYCKDLSNISDTLIIKNRNKEFILSAEGDSGSTDIILGETLSGVEFNNLSGDNFEGHFNMKYILMFIKNSNLCTNVEIFLKEDHPMILVYSVASLGSLKFVLAPKIVET